MTRPHVVILGGGFGGLAAARTLRRAPVEVTLVDQSNHHLFQPLLYQVATSALTAPDIAAPLRKLLAKQDNAKILMAKAMSVKPDARTVELDKGELRYDYLIVATGMVNNYFGHPEWEEHAPGLKSLRDALDIRSRVLRAYEAAERETDPERLKELLTFVIIGAGPTGVEMAGALSEIAKRTLARDFKSFDPMKDVRVVLLEGTDRVLPAMHAESSKDALASLRELDVEVHLETFAEKVDAHGVETADGKRFPASTVIWAAGLKASPITAGLGAELDKAGRVKVEPDLTVPGRSEIFVLGDLISLEQDGEPLPGVAQTALQSGSFAAEQIRADVEDEPREPRFVYRDKGSMATIGRARAVAEVGETRISGFVAWMLWLFIHILFLVDFRNRVAVVMEWMYAYVTWRRSARVILEAPPRKRPALERKAILREELKRESDYPMAAD
ncbi:MAG: NAD(P)/FAD-dependent oxidoreductase [Myxococcota bacterium]|nr:NAD(P)/FAD-dependent oxidoreductase [Myxococcota bacterium]